MASSQFNLQNINGISKNDPADYVLSDELKKAVDIALTLNQPLILTGEPGTGKTQLAYKLANDLNAQTDGDFLKTPLEFHTKTSSVAKDLFYQYDAISHFHDANVMKDEKATSAAPYISLQALGEAIALTNSEYLTSDHSLIPKGRASSSVVLIDEIDKAPRDFPNDILNEIERFQFSISELKQRIVKSPEKRILVIMTSNSEKSLPAPFLRRCIFYHIPFPSPEKLLEIVKRKIPSLTEIPGDKLESAIKFFGEVRERVKKKMPATSELISWLHVLEMEDFFTDEVNFSQLTDNQRKILNFSYSILIKDKDDMLTMK